MHRLKCAVELNQASEVRVDRVLGKRLLRLLQTAQDAVLRALEVTTGLKEEIEGKLRHGWQVFASRNAHPQK
jgi:hypothetical protein